MRPKAFRKTTDAAGWTSDYAKPGDRNIDPEVARALRHFRALLWSVDDTPSRASVRETLSRLGSMSPEEAAQRWSELDDSTQAEIERAQWEVVGRTGPPLAITLPELSRHALNTMELHQGGRPPVGKLAVMLASALAAHWTRITCTPPTVRIVDFDPTPFMAWARLMFEAAGYPTGDLYKHLRDGVRAARSDGRIPTK